MIDKENTQTLLSGNCLDDILLVILYAFQFSKKIHIYYLLYILAPNYIFATSQSADFPIQEHENELQHFVLCLQFSP